MKLYEASVHEPYTTKARTLQASTEARLKVSINLRINALVREVKHSLSQSLLAIGVAVLLYLVAAFFWSASIYVLIVLLVAFITRRSNRLNPLARLYYTWRCLKMWEVELARRNAPESQNWYC